MFLAVADKTCQATARSGWRWIWESEILGRAAHRSVAAGRVSGTLEMGMGDLSGDGGA